MLYEFDTQMNTSDVTCLRYLDDFIIFAPSYKAARGAYTKAQRLLSKHGLAAYNIDTEKDKTKADKGKIEEPFEFLGVEFRNRLIRPSSAAKNRLIDSIGEILGNVLKTGNANEKSQNIISALYYISNKIRGWGNQYKFCNDTRLMGSIDAEISQLIIPYFFKFSKHLSTQPLDMQRKLIGTWSLHDCKSEPIKF